MQCIDIASNTPFKPVKIARAAQQMKSNKTTAMAAFPIEYIRIHVLETMWCSLSVLFSSCITTPYLDKLNATLFMVLYKKGPLVDCIIHRETYLMHPIGKLFSKVIISRLEGDSNATRASC